MQQYSLATVIESLAKRLEAKQLEDFEQIIYPTLNQFPDNAAVWFYLGYYHNLLGNTAMAVEAWRRSYEIEPRDVVLVNWGAALKDTGRPLESRALLKRALFQKPDDVPALVNLIGSYVNEGEPWEGIEYGEQLERVDPGNLQGKFNRGLLHLEAGDYETGFRFYAEGYHSNRDRREYKGAQELSRDNFEQAKGKRLIVFGEQGLGDELMFFCMIPAARLDFQLTLDVHPRLETLHRMTVWGDLPMYPSRKEVPEWYKEGDTDYYTSVGNLAQFYWDKRVPSPYKCNPGERDLYRQYLEILAPGKKIIGVALRGGTLKTARTYRVIAPPDLDPLWKRDDLVFVSLDYDDVSNVQEWVTATYGPHKFMWYPGINWTWDVHHKAALIAACDATVTVCQTAAHLSAGMGLPTHVLTPRRCAWRYGVRDRTEGGEPWFLYPHGKALLHRQGKDDSYVDAIADIGRMI